MSSERDEQNGSEGSGSGGPSEGSSSKGGPSKRGRPTKPPEEKRTESYGLRLSPNEMEELEERCEAAGLSKAEYLRRRALGKPVSTKVDQEMTRELNRVGTNLNQIAYRANRGELPDVAAAAEEAIEEVRALIGEIGQMQSK
ncbi:plasmid mobilization protein [Salinibacter ruber]|jgi:hypothetical protein|uniref:plasmid mobilization protein n=1 Tax=Salinibacter ruber TaxID=146919 RepID=UPI002169ECDA|nr:plasmid mobilization relaxosome protein MobC [Salinibacter ruber]MCS4201923.1 hypothetical protein [Salinibacter ruber]